MFSKKNHDILRKCAPTGKAYLWQKSRLHVSVVDDAISGAVIPVIVS